MTSTSYPRRPKPIVPIINGLATACYVAVTVLYFVDGKPGWGAFWAAMSLLWLCGTLPMSIRTHRLQVSTWEIRRRASDRFGSLS